MIDEIKYWMADGEEDTSAEVDSTDGEDDEDDDVDDDDEGDEPTLDDPTSAD